MFTDNKDDGYLKFEINKELIPITNTKINQVLSFIKDRIQFSNPYHVIRKVNFKINNLLYDKYKCFLSLCSPNSLEKKIDSKKLLELKINLRPERCKCLDVKTSRNDTRRTL